MRVPRFENSIKPPVVAASFTDIDPDIPQLAAHKIAAQFSLPVSIAKVVVRLAGIGDGGRQ